MIHDDKFTIKRRHLFDFNIFHSIIKENISEENNKNSGYSRIFTFLYHFLALIFVPLISSLITIQLIKEGNNYFIVALPIILTVIQYFYLKSV